MKATILQGLARLLAAILLTACATPLPEQPTIGSPTASKASRALQTRQHGGGGGSLQTCARDRQDCERRPRAATCRS